MSRFLTFLLLAVAAAHAASGGPSPLAKATLVVFNSRDPLSSELAGYYAKKRNIPEEQVVGLETSIEEEITRAEYDATIAEPLKHRFLDSGWWTTQTDNNGKTRVVHNQIRFVALIRGIPLKIASCTGYPGDAPQGPAALAGKNEACVDSELAALGFLSRSISGGLNNPYYRSFVAGLDAPCPELMFVTRLDAPLSAQVRQMIDDALETEANGLRGFAYIDERSIQDPGFAVGDTWLEGAAKSARKAGMPVVVDRRPGVFPKGYPMREVALYYGWYERDVTGPFSREDFRFNRGAVACHIHSYSAETVRNPIERWAGPLLMRGAAAVLGNVYEPFLACTPELDVLQEHLRNGYTLAESAYSATRCVSWMNTVIGDPLYRPFALWQDLGMTPQEDVPWEKYRKAAILWSQARGKGEAAMLNASRENGGGLFMEGLGLLQADAKDFPAALRSFAKAQESYAAMADKLRVAIHQAQIVCETSSKEAALKFVRQQIKAFPGQEGTAVLREMEAQLIPPPAPSGR